MYNVIGPSLLYQLNNQQQGSHRRFDRDGE